jgi:hypothetical protein
LPVKATPESTPVVSGLLCGHIKANNINNIDLEIDQFGLLPTLYVLTPLI